jgi:Tol biopolymer transport system component
MPQWSQDGKRIYYRSGASDQMYSVTVAAGGVKRLGEGFAPQESPDGRWLYYLSKRAGGGLQFQLMRRQVGDDSAEAEALPVESGLNFLVTLGGVWFLPPGRGRLSNTLSYHDFATGSTRVVYESASPLWAGLSISPDGRRLLVTQVERGPSLDLMLAEGFR